MLHKIMALFRKKEQPKEFKVPNGYRLVPEIPSEAHVESMCMRFDHSHGMKHDFPLPESDENFRMQQDFNRRVVRQIYEEATGQGFYHRGESCGATGGAHDWVDARNSFVKSGYYCAKCGAITGSEPNRTVEPPLATYPCSGCGQQAGVEDWEAFDPNMHYCGRSERCIP